MSSLSSKGNDFGAFLGALNQQNLSGGINPYELAKQGGGRGDPSSRDTVWNYLVNHDGPVSVAKLMQETPISYGALSDALDTLRTAQWIQVTQDGTDERVTLTDIGRQIVKLGLK